ncbi:hypothetical protein B0H66DRAFT_134290 [Apodospora peruviana]|uniref:HD/PDEase domain-containing protein n=1 Tax=Apodospora peruviana TaxID=516989 RepID=A0AAE0MAS8_9PEZI|nr:hypothetical protein B0H66DRAFT_134290 [Apodospora peruviana]
MDTFSNDPLVQAITAYVQEYMQNYDPSHSWDHIERVVGLARYIYSKSQNRELLDLRTIQLAALLHDVGDRKYLKPNQDPKNLISEVLLANACPAALASKIQTICHGVSYTTETKDPAHVRSLIAEYPELAVVQDADRLDAIGAVGIGRMFTFGGAKTGRPMDESMQHFDDKLLKLEGMIKTDVGRELARERTERLRVFKEWWGDEVAFSLSGTTSS